MPKFVGNCLLICRRLLFSSLNLYLKKEKVCSYPQLIYYLKKEKNITIKITIKLLNTLFKLLNMYYL